MIHSWTLQVLEAGQRTHQLAAVDGLTLGRHPDCGLILQDSHVSARHARIIAKGNDLAILDLGSNNGTHIDNTTVLRKGQDQVLRDGMHIAIGRVEIVVRGSGAGSTETLHGETTAPPDSASAPATMMAGEPADGASTMPAVTPAPAVAPAPAPVEPPPAPPSQPQAPAAQSSDSSFSAFDSMALNTILGEGDDDNAARVKLARMGGRLVLLNEADRRVVDVDSKEFTIGRKEGINCTLRNRGVSSDHARIVFSPLSNMFFIEDLGSANGTQLDGAPLTVNAPRELHSDAHIRFGTIEAVFLQDLDSELLALSKDRHTFAAKLLAGRGQLTNAALKQAKQDAKEQGASLGEVLLLGQLVTPREWARSVDDARVAATLNQLNPTDPKRVLLWMLVGLLLLGAALMATPAGRRLLGFAS